MRKNENGRSMIEMLGVLAIIGVLSVGGIYGYTVAMRKYKANEVAQTLSMLATLSHSANAGRGDTVTLAESGLEVKPAGVDLTGISSVCATDCEIATISITAAAAFKGSSADTKLKEAVCAIVPTDDTMGARAGYKVTNCPS